MSTTHFADAQGVYLGGFGDGAVPPEGAVEVPAPPHGLATWDGAGWHWDAAAHARETMTLSFAQLVTGLVAEAWISEAEGEAWLAGVLPAAVLAVIGTLPAQARFAAKARATRPSIIERTDPLVAALAAAQDKTEAQLDTFFIGYAGV